jgi:hypothetical protein
MTKTILLTLTIISTTLLFSGCVNKHGISAKYYSECKEYYDLQGYYHKECGEDDIVTYKAIGEVAGKVADTWTKKKPKPKGNVW